jgi:hypothetical protein
MEREFECCVKLFQNYQSKGFLMKFFSAKSVQSQFELQDGRLTKCIIDATLGMQDVNIKLHKETQDLLLKNQQHYHRK